MASSTNQAHAERLRTAVREFEVQTMSLSSVDVLCQEVLRVADRLAPAVPAPAVRRRTLRAVRS